MRLSIILFFLFSLSIMPCEISGPEKLVISDQEKSLNIINELTFKDCNQSLQKEIHNTLSDFQGSLSQNILIAEGLNAKLKSTIKFSKVSDLLNDKYELPKSWRFIDSKVVGSQKSFLTISSNHIVSVHCDSCSSTGKKNIKIEITNPFTAQKKVSWVQSIVAVKTKVLVSKFNVKAFSGALSIQNFKQKTLYVSNPEHFFTNIDKLPYYKLNKSVEIDSKLKFRDMSPMALVKPGHPVRLMLKSGTLRLSSKAIPIRSGKLGEVIQLRNPNTKKIIIGKVTDFNEVEVEL